MKLFPCTLLLLASLASCIAPSRPIAAPLFSWARLTPNPMNELQFLPLPGNRVLSYREYGNPRGRHSLLFFHGWPSSAKQGEVFDAVGRALDVRVYALNRPGLEQSTFVPNRRLKDWPEDIRRFADAKNLPRFMVCGISGGAPYALACAHDLPDRVQAAAIVSGAPPIAEAEDKKFLNPLYRLLAGVNRVAPRFIQGSVAASSLFLRYKPAGPMRWALLRVIPPADRAALTVPAQYDSAYASFRGAITSPSRAVAWDGGIYMQPWGFKPEDIRVPVTFWHGRQDVNFKVAVAEELARRVPGSRGHFLADEGHYSIEFNRPSNILKDLLSRIEEKRVAQP